jgi:hypothetical protein
MVWWQDWGGEIVVDNVVNTGLRWCVVFQCTRCTSVVVMACLNRGTLQTQTRDIR